MQCYKDVKNAHPEQDYGFLQIPDYGHLDCIFGKNAVYDVYPHVLRVLDRHARDDLHVDHVTQSRVVEALKKVKSLKG